MINDFVLLRFRARVPEDLSAIEVIFIIIIIIIVIVIHHRQLCECFCVYSLNNFFLLRHWLVPSSGVACIAVYLLLPCCPVCCVVLFL